MIRRKMEGEHIIEVNDLVTSLSRARSGKNAGFPLIQKMRRMAPCDQHEDVYRPGVVSIGPYHHKAVDTPEIEQRKWESFCYILKLNPEKKMRDYLEAMAAVEQQIRSCYASEIKLTSDEFKNMVLLDGCFILCTLCGTEGAERSILSVDMLSADDKNLSFDAQDAAPSMGECVSQPSNGSCTYIDNGPDPDSFYYSKYWYTATSTQDLVLLENQIPFFVIVKLFEVATNGNMPTTILMKNVASFIKDLLLSYPGSHYNFDRPNEVHHLLYLCHQYFKPHKTNLKGDSNLSTYDNDDTTRSVKLLGWHQTLEYHKAGIVFKKREPCSENPHSLLDIGFCNGVIETPCLTIDTNTHCLFRNLLAFEETCPSSGNYFTAYVVFLSQLISTAEDVYLLIKTSIIVHQLDSDAEVAGIFTMLAKDVTFDFNSDHCLKHLCHEMELQYQMQRPRWKEWLGTIGSKLAGSPHESSKPNQMCTRSSPDACV